MAVFCLMNFSSLLDEGKCFEFIRQHRWPDGVICTSCGSSNVIRDGHDDSQPQRQRYCCKACRVRFDDLTGTALSGHHQPLRVWVTCLYLMGLNISNLQISDELGLCSSDGQAMTEHLRHGLVVRMPAVKLEGQVEADEVYIVAGHKGQPAKVEEAGRAARCRRLQGAPGRGTLEKDKPPVLGLIQRGGQVVLHLLPNVQQATIKPIIIDAVVPGTLIHTDEYNIYARLPVWGYEHKTVCHAHGEYARDEDGDGFCEVHVNTIEGFWSLLRSWLRPHRGISQDKLPLYLGFFQFVHNARRRGRALLGPLIAGLVA